MNFLLIILLFVFSLNLSAKNVDIYLLKDICSFYVRTSNNNISINNPIKGGVYLEKKKICKLSHLKDGSILINDFRGKVLKFTSNEVRASVMGLLTEKEGYLFAIYQNRETGSIKILVYNRGSSNTINSILTFIKEDKGDKVKGTSKN